MHRTRFVLAVQHPELLKTPCFILRTCRRQRTRRFCCSSISAKHVNGMRLGCFGLRRKLKHVSNTDLDFRTF